MAVGPFQDSDLQPSGAGRPPTRAERLTGQTGLSTMPGTVGADVAGNASVATQAGQAPSKE
jgi:hypothetical protein